MKIRVGFIVSDKIYIERLVSTLNRYYSDKLEIYSYTDVKVANESVENQRLDIVIVDETLQVNEYRNCCMAYFVESPDIDKIEGKKAICKFQKVELIYKDILALYSEYSSRNSKTMFTITAEIEVPPMMMDQPLASDYRKYLDNGQWNRYTLKMSRGY